MGKVKEFIYLLEDLSPEQIQGLGMDELKAFLQEQLRKHDLKEGQIEQQRPGTCGGRTSSFFSRSIRLGSASAGHECPT